MTNFDPKGDMVPIEDWELMAEQKAAETGASWRILGGIISGGVGLALSFEVLGIVAGGWLFYQAYERIKNSGKDLQAVRDFGCVAHLLEETEFRTFAKQFGDKEVYEQLVFAEERGWNISKFAQNWLDTKDKPKALTPTQEVAALPEKTTEKTSSYRDRLAARKETTPVNEAPTTKTQVDVHQAESEINLISEMTESIGNYFVVGLGGSGKGMVLANALRNLKQLHPHKKVFLINGKNDSKESGYFDGIVDVELRLHCETATPEVVKQWFEIAIAKYDKFAAENDGALLVVDEGTIIGARLKTAKCTTLTDKVIGITSCGGSTGKNIWFVAQTPYVGANGSDLSGISQLTPLAIVSDKNLAVIDSWKRASLFKKFDADKIARLVSKSDCNRAVYFGKNAKWYSMPSLKNYSAFNRDTGEIIGEIKKTQPREHKTVVQQLEDNFNSEFTQETEVISDDLIDCIFIDKISQSEETVSFESIRSHVKRNYPDGAKRELIRAALDKLVSEDLIVGDEDSGYTSK